LMSREQSGCIEVMIFSENAASTINLVSAMATAKVSSHHSLTHTRLG
jgi:hypothetical protein